MFFPTTSTYEQRKEYFYPRQQEHPAPPRFTTRSAAMAVCESERADEEMKQLAIDEKEAEQVLEKARVAFVSEKKRIEERRAKLKWVRSEGEDARRFILSTSLPSEEEQELLARGKRLAKEAGRLQALYRVYTSEMVDPAKHEDTKKLASLEQEIDSCRQRATSASSRVAGTSGADIKLRQLLGAHEVLKPSVDKYHTDYKHWQEIQRHKQEAAECWSERERLQLERESAALAAALKAIK